MSLRSILAALRSIPTRSRLRAAGRQAGFRPRLEPLDDRRLPSFSAATNFPVGANPQAVAAADFDEDGDPDLATTNYDAGTVSVLLGDGQGGFGEASHFTAGSNPGSLAVGDFDNDGNLDLASANRGDYDVAVLLGNGDGTFRPPVSAGAGTDALSMAVGDFNADGNLDLVATVQYYDLSWGGYQGYVTVLLGDGGGGFAVSDWDAVASEGPVGLAVADLNGDGNPDVVTANEGYGSVSVLLGNGDGTLSYGWGGSDFAAGPSPRAVAVGDFTGDGVPDLVTAGQTVDVLPGNGDGTFAAPVPSSAGNSWRTAVAAADLNGDGYLDAVTADPGTGTVTALLGWGDSTLTQAADHPAGSWPVAVAVGDFDGDGRPDVAAAGPDAASVLLNDGAWPDANSPRVRVADATVTEGDAGVVYAVFTVTLSAATGQPVTVTYATAAGTARAGLDYDNVSGSVTFAPDETSKTIAVPVHGDLTDEWDETFSLNLSSAGVLLADSQGQGAIADNDPVPTLVIRDASVTEGHTGTRVMVYTVTLSAPSEKWVSVYYSTADGTARAAEGDYVRASGYLYFGPGETSKTVSVTVRGDTRKEKDETFVVNLGTASHATVSDGQGVGTILDDDTPPRRK